MGYQTIARRLSDLEAWEKTVYIVFISQVTSVIGFSMIFPFFSLFAADLGSSTGMSIELLAGLVFSSQAFTMMLSAPMWGAIADRYGRKLMIARATFGGAIIILLMGFSRSAEMLVVLRAIQGVITGTVPAANALVAATAPREKMGYAMGLMQMALWTGVAIGPLIGGTMADAFGYQAAFSVTAVLLLLSGFLVWFGVKENFEPQVDERGKHRSVWQDWKEILSAVGVIPAYFIRFLVGIGQTIIIPLAPLFIIQLMPVGSPVNFFTGLMIAISGAASTATAVYLGRLGDRVGHRPILLFSIVGVALSYLPQPFVNQAWQLMVLQALTGAAYGGIIPSLTALLAQFTKPGEEGSVYGFDSSIQAASRTVAPLLGAGIAVWFSIRATLGATGLLFVVIFILAIRFMPAMKEESDDKSKMTA